MKVIPTVFSKNKKKFDARFEKLRKISEELQIDFMDGKFVKNTSIHVKDVPSLFKYNNVVEAHLMVKNPDEYIDDLRKKGFGRIIFHFEAIKDDKKITSLIKKIRGFGLHAVVAVNPETDIRKLKNIIPELHTILLMGVHPGKEKQKLLNSTFTKIKYLKQHFPDLLIQVDGGINTKTSSKLFNAGVDILNSGSFVSNSKNPKKAIRELQNE